MDAAETGNAVDNTWVIERADLGFEFMMNALRLTHGFESTLFTERTGLPWQTMKDQLTIAQTKQLLTITDTHVAPSARGQRYLNDLLALFLD